MEKPIKIILIVSSMIVITVLSCIFVKYCTTRYRIMEENINIRIKNRVIPIDSDEEYNDKFNENEIRIQELTNDNKV
jgi:hypothetical protein